MAGSTSSTTMHGTCFTESECRANGGRSSGNCAAGQIQNFLLKTKFKHLFMVKG